MKHTYKTLFAIGLAGFMLSCSHKAMKEEALNTDQTPLSAEQIQNTEQLARQAYTFGYPLVLMDTARQANAENSKAWIDLSHGPVVISVPEMGKRFYVGNLFNGWSELTTVIGTRTTGNHKANFVVVGPNWSGDLPANMQVIQSATNLAWFPVQIDSFGKKDAAAARRLQQQFKITALEQWNEAKAINRDISNDAAAEVSNVPIPSDQVFAMDAATFYGKLCQLMIENPPAVADSPLMLQLQSLGIQPTANFDMSKLPVSVQQALIFSVSNSKDYIMAREGELAPSEAINGWSIHTNTASFGTDYDRRAFVALTDLGAGDAKDIMTFTTSTDNLGQKLNGQFRYQISFDKGQLPPVKASWALLTSGTQLMLGSRSHLKRQADGSTTLYIQSQTTAKARHTNWLKAPSDDFQLSLQLYFPKQQAVDLKWEPPTVERVIETSPLVMAN